MHWSRWPSKRPEGCWWPPSVNRRSVYAINPLAVARIANGTRSPAKSDHADAMTLANILRVDAHLHRPLPADTELCQAITVLARAHQDAIWARTRAIQRVACRAA